MWLTGIEKLESRRLLSGGVVVNGSLTTVATIPSAFAPTAVCSIGSGGTFIAYIKNNVLDGVILDSSGNVAVSEFAISPQSDSASQFSNIAAVEDSNGNAVIVYATNPGSTYKMTRVSSSGQIVNQATTVIAGLSPALAAAPDGSVAMVIRNPSAGNGASDSIMAVVVDSSDNPKFTPISIDTIASNAPGGAALTNLTVIYSPSTGNFLAAWDEEDFTSGATGDTQELIDTNTLSASGTAGTQRIVATEPNTSSSDNVLQQPLLLLNDDNSTFTIYYVDNYFGPSPDFTFGGSHVFAATISGDGSLSGTPADTYDTTAPNEIQLSSGEQYTASQITSSELLTGKITPLANVMPITNVLYGNTGTYNGSSFVAANTLALVFQAQIFLVANVLTAITNPGALADSFSSPLGYIEWLRDLVGGNTTITSQPAHVAQVSTKPTVSVSNGTQTSLTNMQFILSLDKADPDRDVNVLVHTSGDGSNIYYEPIPTTPIFGPPPSGKNFIIPSGQTSVTVNVDLSPFAPSSPVNVTLMIINASVNIGAQSGTGTIAPLSGTTQTATPKHPVTTTDSNGTSVTISTTNGSVSVTNSSGNIIAHQTVSSAKSVTSITSKSHTPPEILGFSSDQPMKELNAPTVDITGDLNFNGVETINAHDAKDNHQIRLGAVSNATLKFNDVASTDLTFTGSIKQLSVNSWTGGSIGSGSIGTLNSKGNFDADMLVTSVSKMSIGGILGGTSSSDYRQMMATSSFGTITLGGFENASLFAGLDGSITTLPTDESAFVSSSAFIKSLTIKGASAIFSDADVAATTIDSITVAGLQADNATPFGVVAEKILKYKQAKMSKTKVTTPQTVDSSGEYSAKTV